MGLTTWPEKFKYLGLLGLLNKHVSFLTPLPSDSLVAQLRDV